MSEQKTIVGCQPKDGRDRRLLERATGQAMTPLAGATDGACAKCGRAVLVGPRQQVKIEAGLSEPWCFFCVAFAAGGQSVVLRSLGNPEG